MQTVKLLNLDIHNVSRLQLLKALRKGGVVFTANLDHLSKLQADEEFYSAYQAANYCVCDSQILLFISRLLGMPFQEKISGSDFFPDFCEYYSNDDSVKIFLLGAAPGVALKAQEKINRKIGREIVVAAHSPSFGFEKDEVECREIVNMINQSGATVLAIGVGAPKQEKWVHKYRSQLRRVKTILAIGAALDFEAGHVKRSPKWMSEAGLEWLYRISQDRKRLWKRYIVDDLPCLLLFLKQKFNLYRNPWSDRASQYRPKQLAPSISDR
jgi:N-acetylglucosaminyldiphosphoundecaprenol N-acetyl-beta-D-mannosaminyltransferase